MYSRQRYRTRLSRPAPPAVQSLTIPASTRGIDAVSSLMQMPADASIYAYNIMPVEYGSRLRQGYREWATGCVESPQRGTGEVRTVIGYESNDQDVANDRLFAVTDEGIWDVTTFNTTSPSQEVVFTALGDAAGRGVFTEFTGDAANSPGVARGHYLFYADGLNGLHQYQESTGLWTVPVSGIADDEWWYADPANPGTRLPFPVDDIAFVMVHKQRIWVILENSDDAWYLPVASISGELKRFFFGSKFANGGNLMGLWTWTIDGGDGVDDFLVALSRGGDVVIYRGEDPEIIPDGSSIGPWSTVGSWYIGEIPESRRVAVSFGSDMFILSVFGLTSLYQLLRGEASEGTDDGAQAPSKMIARFLRTDVKTGKDINQWQLTVNPADGFLQIVTPTPTNHAPLQYAMNLTTSAWGLWEGVPVTCGSAWNGDYFMGADATYQPNNRQTPQPGVVLIYDDTLDGTTIQGDDEFVANALEGGSDPAWTQPVPATNDYACDNSADTVNQAIATIDIGFTPVVGLQYRVDYTVATSTPAAEHQVRFGDTTGPMNISGGTFSETYTATSTSSLVQLVGGPEFVGNISSISVYLAPVLGTTIDFRALTAFQSPGEHARNLQVGIIRTLGVLAGSTNINVQAVYDYNIEQVLPPPTAVTGTPGDVWDSALWDRATWDYSLEGKSFTAGTSGIGRVVAVAIRGTADTRLNIVGWDLLLKQGGYL